jgi:hypothetical protein
LRINAVAFAAQAWRVAHPSTPAKRTPLNFRVPLAAGEGAGLDATSRQSHMIENNEQRLILIATFSAVLAGSIGSKIPIHSTLITRRSSLLRCLPPPTLLK